MTEFMEAHLLKALFGGVRVDLVELKLCLDAGLDVNFVFTTNEAKEAGVFQKTLLYHATLSENRPLVDLLLSRPDVSPEEAIDRNEEDSLKRTAIFAALHANDSSLFPLLLKKTPPTACVILDSLGGSLLWHAANMGQKWHVRSLMLHCPNIAHVPDNTGLYPLHVSAVKNDADVINILMEFGAKVDVLQFRGATPLGLSINVETRAASLALLRHGAMPRHRADRHMEDAPCMALDCLAKSVETRAFLAKIASPVPTNVDLNCATPPGAGKHNKLCSSTFQGRGGTTWGRQPSSVLARERNI